MRRFFVSPEELKKETVILKDDEFHHLKNVCRLEEGERIELLDGQGHVALSLIKNIDKKQALIEVQETKKLPPLAEPHIEIILSLPRFQTMDEIIQKSVELGVKKIIPVLSDRSFLKKPSSDLKAKIERWNKIGLSACKQSGRAWPMEITQAVEIEKLLEEKSSIPSLFLYEGEAAQDIHAALAKLTKPRGIRVYIGAEGGFSPREVELFQAAGMLPITLGDLVLRVETACIAATAVIKYHFNLLK